jgi:hypothetical protein
MDMMARSRTAKTGFVLLGLSCLVFVVVCCLSFALTLELLSGDEEANEDGASRATAQQFANLIRRDNLEGAYQLTASSYQKRYDRSAFAEVFHGYEAVLQGSDPRSIEITSDNPDSAVGSRSYHFALDPISSGSADGWMGDEVGAVLEVHVRPNLEPVSGWSVETFSVSERRASFEVEPPARAVLAFGQRLRNHDVAGGYRMLGPGFQESTDSETFARMTKMRKADFAAEWSVNHVEYDGDLATVIVNPVGRLSLLQFSLRTRDDPEAWYVEAIAVLVEGGSDSKPGGSK